MTRLLYDLPAATEVTSMSADTLLKAVGAGRLKAKKSGINDDGEPVGKWMFTHAALEAFVDGLADA